MPIYEYVCPTCKNQFEKLRSFVESESAVCPDCGTKAAKVFSMIAAPVRVGAGPSASGGGCACGGNCGC